MDVFENRRLCSEHCEIRRNGSLEHCDERREQMQKSEQPDCRRLNIGPSEQFDVRRDISEQLDVRRDISEQLE